MKTRMWALLLCMLPTMTHAQDKGYTLSTDDTSIRVEALDNRLVVTSLLSKQTGKDWIGGTPQAGQEAVAPAPIPFIEKAEWEGNAATLTWRFVGSRVLEGFPRRLVLTFVSVNPSLQLQSVWQARSGPGPIEHHVLITNREKFPIQIPAQTSLMFSAVAPPGSAFDHWWVEKGSQWPTPYGTHDAPLTVGYAANLFSIPYAVDDDKKRDPIPWTAIQDKAGKQGLCLGVEFSGRVRIGVQGMQLPAEALRPDNAAGQVIVDAGIDPDADAAIPFRTRIAPGESFETPTVFLGCYAGDVDDGANRLHRWIERYLRPPVHDARYPLLTNNTWGSGMAVDDKLARKMIDDSVDLGLEMFHIDAGWFKDVGDWYPDPKKFPNGLAPIADYVHGKGLLFGLWVGWTQGGIRPNEPDKQTVLSVFDPQMRAWFTHDYKADWKPSEFTGADVCLGDPRAVDWCIRELRRIVKDYKIDMLEHDQRMIVETCDRTDHSHLASASDVAYHAAKGYYKVYDTIRMDNLRLLFENCVNGGHTVDYGIVQRTHYISITDTYDPLSNRRAFYDASYAFPPSMCEAYIENHEHKNLAEFLYMLRSGMMGWCTIMCDTSKWTKEEREAAKAQFALYKEKLRPLIAGGNIYHVTERPNGVHWDGMQYVDTKTGDGALFAFRGTTPEERNTIVLKGLEENTRYRVTFTDKTSEPLTRSGKELMNAGIPFHLPLPNSSEIAILSRAN